jgi:photosystem II stability/assembly factor-like uncharacterized protein
MGSIWSSKDGGQSWRRIVDDRVGRGTTRAQAIVAAPSAEGVFYASTRYEYLYGFSGIIRTQDGGDSWRGPGGSPDRRPLTVDATDPDTIYVGSLQQGRLLRSRDAGTTYEDLAAFLSPVSALAMSVDGSRLWVAVATGELYRSADRGTSWDRVIDTPYQGRLISLCASPQDPRLFFAVSSQGELWAYREPDAPRLQPLAGGRAPGDATVHFIGMEALSAEP